MRLFVGFVMQVTYSHENMTKLVKSVSNVNILSILFSTSSQKLTRGKAKETKGKVKYVNKPDGKKNTALHLAIAKGHLAMVNLLLHHRAGRLKV